MSREKARAKRSEKGLLTPDNCVLTLIDLQPQMLFGVANFDRQAIINNNVALSKAARVFDVPVVLSTVETKGFSGNMWPQVQAVFPKQTPIERSSMNAWDDENFVAACGRKPASPCRRSRPSTTATKSTSSRTAAATSASSPTTTR